MNPKLRLADALIWTFAIAFGTVFALSLVIDASRAASEDLVTLGGVQIAVYLAGCALFAARRPGSSWSDLFALRPVSPLLLVVALLFGIALNFPAEWSTTLIQKYFPLSPEAVAELSARLTMRSPSHGVVLFLVAAVLGPLVEELLFRGALFTGLRPAHSPGVAVAATSILFTVTHVEPRFFLPIAVLSLLIGWLRAASGSLAPALLMHVGFNGTALAMAFAHGQGPEKPPSTALVLGASAAALVLFVAARVLVANNPRAIDARRLDGEAPAIAGETLS